ncbi:hypothetical protein RIF29_18201 [Crotalaria pallida]|uniref:Uncharacterized protein n=1 Tax=Crotalaria pallida TaxID=3830 RepID=A0AAN9FIJ5_CROPI
MESYKRGGHLFPCTHRVVYKEFILKKGCKKAFSLFEGPASFKCYLRINRNELITKSWGKSRFTTPKGRDPVVIRMTAMGCAWLGRSLAIL